jgi:hypothetical protein
MKDAFEMSSGGMIYIPSFSHSWEDSQTQKGDLASLLLFY